jgi:hypothetical protein
MRRLSEHDINDIMVYFKQWLPLANQNYRQMVIEEHQGRKDSEQRLRLRDQDGGTGVEW